MCVRHKFKRCIKPSAILVLWGASWVAAGQQPIAFVNVTVVPMDQERVLPGQTVLVVGQRIAQMAPATAFRPPANAVKIDGKGEFLMPGLADMHVHLIRSLGAVRSQKPPSVQSGSHVIPPLSASDDHEGENRALGLLFVSNGITAVRNMWGDSAIDTFATEVESRRVVGPHVYSTGPITDGSPSTWQGSRIVASQSEAEAAVEDDVRAHRIALKVYNGLSADAYGWLVSSARSHGLPIVGHVPYSVGLPGVIEARQRSIEHLDGFLEALQPDPASVTDATTMKQLLGGADMRRLPALADTIGAGDIWNCPTLVLYEDFAEDAEWERRIALVPPALVERYQRGMPHWSAHPEVRQRVYDLYLAIVRGLHDRGAHLLLGTDTPKPTVLPGFSLQAELRSFVRAGLTPYEALRAGSSDAAVFLHQEKEFGTVALGVRADLLLLKANPLESVDNIEKRVGVMVAGRWFVESELQRRLLATQEKRRR
jgi:cytosine/adenosine deaminase-related metal-dependent hydrolase